MPLRLDVGRIISAISGKQVFVAPDFFIDHFVKYPKDYSSLIAEFHRVISQGGGNVLGTEQYIAKGGNAVNTAIALGYLQVRTNLFTVTDDLGFHLLKYFIGDLPIDISCVRTNGIASITTAFEVRNEKQNLTNIMVSASGSLLTLSPEHLTDAVLDLVRRSSIVCFFNWSQTKRGGDIAETLFKVAREGGAMTFFDSGDPSYRRDEMPRLINQIFDSDLVDVMSLNENEFAQFSKSLGLKFEESRGKELWTNLLKFSERLSCRIDYHTTEFSATAHNGSYEVTPCFRIEPMRATGAGDTWNAGDILGYLSGLSTTERLLLANAAAAYYIANPIPKPATLEEVVRFASSKPLKEVPTL